MEISYLNKEKTKNEHLEISQTVLRKGHAPIRFEVDEAEPEHRNAEQDRRRRFYYEAIDLTSLNS